MVIALEYDYFKPTKLRDALALKARYGAEAQFLAGGTDLIVNLLDETVAPKAVIDLKGIKELSQLQFKNRRLWVGALVTFSDLLASRTVKQRFPLLWEAAGEVASVSIRNRATMVGNICSCVPCMDSAPALVIHEAVAIIQGSRSKRNLPINELFLGPRKTSLAEDEVIVGLSIPRPAKKNGTCYLKLKRYRGEDLSQAGVAVMVMERYDYRVAYGSVGPVPIRARSIEKELKGKKPTPALLATAAKLVEKEIAPITDVRASKEYRLHICEVMLKRAVETAVSRLKGKGPKLGTRLI